MVEVTYHCPYCGALTSLEREGYLADRCVTREPLEGWEYAPTTGDYEDADGVEFVCLGDATLADDETVADPDRADPHPARIEREDADRGSVATDEDADRNPEGPGTGDEEVGDGCGRTFYLSFVRYEDGEEVDPQVALVEGEDPPRFDFLG